MGVYHKITAAIKRLTIYDYIAIVIFLIAIGLRLAFYQHCLWVDEARDLTITRNLVQTGNPTFFGQPYLQHPILNYIILAISTAIFGLNGFGGTIVPVLWGALTVLVVYGIGKTAFNNKVGILAALLMLIQPLHWFYSNRILNDVPNTFFFALTIYAFVKFIKTKENRFLYITGLMTALAVLTRVSSFALLPIFLIYFLLDKDTRHIVLKGVIPKRNLLMACGIFLLIFVASLAYNQLAFGKAFDMGVYTFHAFVVTFDAQPWWYYLTTLHSFARIELTVLFGLGLVLALLKKSKYAILLLLTFIIFIIEISAVNVKVDRYIMPAIPILAIFGGYSLAAIMATLKKYSNVISYIFVVLIMAWTLFSFYTDGSSMITSMADGFCGLDQVGAWIKQNVSPNDSIVAGSSTIVGFYSERDNLQYIPENSSVLEAMFKNGSVKFLEVDMWERTQPSYIFDYVTNNSHLTPVNAALINNQAVSIVYMYNSETVNKTI